MDLTRDRFELKYEVSAALYPHLRAELRPRLIVDPAAGESGRYTVRSLYYDTADGRAYWEKNDGLRYRRKVRLRTYGGPGDGAPLFAEVKHKLGERILKDRVGLAWSRLESPDRVFAPAPVPADWTSTDRRAFARLASIVERERQSPKLVVAYEREAYFGDGDPRLRLTFDHRVRAAKTSSADTIFSEHELTLVMPGTIVLECKFDGLMPGWLRRTLLAVGLERRSVSKYCLGVDAAGARISERG